MTRSICSVLVCLALFGGVASADERADKSSSERSAKGPRLAILVQSDSGDQNDKDKLQALIEAGEKVFARAEFTIRSWPHQVARFR